MLDAAGNNIYAGTNNGLFVWGAQVELGTEYQTMRNDADNYRYIRTRNNSSSNSYYARIGQDYFPDQVLGGDTADRNYKLVQLLAHKAGTAQDLYININNTEKTWAPQTADVFANVRQSTTSTTALGRRWFQLAPYYNSYVHALDYPSDPADVVRTGSRTGGFRTAPNPYESIAFFQIPKISPDAVSSTDTSPKNFYAKNFYETKTIPRIPKFDAAQVMELFGGYTKSRNISSSNYITLSGDYTYYRNSNWYSPVPNTRWSRFAFGSGDGLGPVMREIFEFTDTLSLIQTYKLPPEYITTPERLFNLLSLSAKQSVIKDLYGKTGNYTTSNSAQVVETFVNYKDGSWFGRSWFRLAPYYNSYTHVVYPAAGTDIILQTDVLRRDVAQDLFTLNNNSSEDYQLVSGNEDYQVLPV